MDNHIPKSRDEKVHEILEQRLKAKYVGGRISSRFAMPRPWSGSGAFICAISRAAPMTVPTLLSP